MIAIQLCSLCLFLAILGCFVIPKKLNFEGSKIFYTLMILTPIAIIFDAFITYSIYESLFNQETLVWLYKIFLILVYLLAYFQFLFLVRKAFTGDLQKRISLTSIILPVTVALEEILLGASIEPIRDGYNVVGNAITAAYLSVGLTGIGIIYLLIKRNKVINTWYRVCFGSAIFIWFLASLAQYFSILFGFVSLAIVVSLISIFAFIKNPLNYTDYKFSCFKNNYIEKLLKRLFDANSNSFVFLVDIDDTNRLKTTSDDINALRMQIINSTKKDKHLFAFITEKNEVFIVGENSDDYLYYKDRISIIIENFYKEYDNKQSFRSLTISCGSIKLFSHEAELIDYFRFTQQRLSNNYFYNTVFEITSSDIEFVHNENAVKEEIMSALNEDRIEAFVQPIYSVDQKRIISAEALARIKKRDGTIMTPYQFIPIAEKSGLDILIGYRIVEKVCQFMHDSVSGKLFDYIDVNLSIAQCESTNLASKIISIAQKYDIKPSRLNFEITETGFINKMSVIEKNIRALTDYGFGFSLDDFGNGESNLNYLITMPVSYVKLDMHMIWDYFKNVRAKKTVQAIIKIAHDMDLKVVAEGVETVEQLTELSNEGVDFIQGYYFFKPMSFKDYLEIAKKDSRQGNLDTKGSDGTMNESANYSSPNDNGKDNANLLMQFMSSTVSSLSSIFLTMHLFDVEERNFKEFTTFNNSRVIETRDVDVQDALNDLISKSATQEWQSKALDFVDLSTFTTRLKEHSFLSFEYVGSVHGWLKAFIIPIKFKANGEISSFWYLLQHIDDEKRHIKMLEELSYSDELTGLPNRRAFDKKIEAIKYQITDDLVVISFDINNLKSINDNYGHHAGDELIRIAGQILKNHLEKYGHIFRTGGDEFCAILNGNYSDISDSLDHMVRDITNWESEEYNTQLSIAYGVSTYSDIADGNFFDFEKFAEARMFKNKSQYYVNNKIDRRKNPFDRRKGGDRRS